jgi:hypothetical protein
MGQCHQAQECKRVAEWFHTKTGRRDSRFGPNVRPSKCGSRRSERMAPAGCFLRPYRRFREISGECFDVTRHSRGQKTWSGRNEREGPQWGAVISDAQRTPEEDGTIIAQFRPKLEDRWSTFPASLPSNTGMQIKNHWYTRV